MSWKKDLMTIYDQGKMIKKLYAHYWELYDGDSKDPREKVFIHAKCKNDVRLEIDKMNFIKKDAISYSVFDDHMRELDKTRFNEFMLSLKDDERRNES